MPRFFNTAGSCRAELHYMLPAAARLPEVLSLVENQAYFVLHAPRQSGKTTSMMALAVQLTATGRYAALHATCEVAAVEPHNPEAASRIIVENIERRAGLALPERLRPPAAATVAVASSPLEAYLAAWCHACPLPVVLFLDEIDGMQDEALISVLRQLRSGYETRPAGFPHSIGIYGMRDVRDYKMASGGSPNLRTSSPFNVKVDSLSLKSFTEAEVATLYRQHTAETGQAFTPEALALAYDLTCGQPWLVNALARQCIEKLVADRSQPITADTIDKAKELLIVSRATHLDSLTERLREDRVQGVMLPIVAGLDVDMSVSPDDIQYVQDLGLVDRKPLIGLDIANPIYREVIPRQLSWAAQQFIRQSDRPWQLADGRLDVDGLMEGFLDFWREGAENMVRTQPYNEAAAQLILQAFFQRVINGGGYIDREYALGSKRLDLCIRWPYEVEGKRQVQRVALELKIWRTDEADPLGAGLLQLDAYLARLALATGFLVIFDRRAKANKVPWARRPRWEAAVTATGRAIRVLRL